MFHKLFVLSGLTALSFASASTQVQYGGINIAGFEFGTGTDGTAQVSGADPPLADSGKGGADGIGQMQHFAQDHKFNAFRLPVSWQYLTNGQVGPLDPTNSQSYDKLVKGCLATQALCIIDVGRPATGELAD